MKNNILKIYLMVCAVFLFSCEQEQIGPTLDLSKATVPTIDAPAAMNKTVAFENSNDVFEKLTWNAYNPNSGELNISTETTNDYTYAVQGSFDPTFSSIFTLVSAQGETEAEISVGVLNKILTDQGSKPGDVKTFYMRVATFLTPEAPIAFTNSFERTVNVFEIPEELPKPSKCGTYCTIGLIGSATPGGWDVDSDMTPIDLAQNIWTIRVFLKADGEIKFRANDDWDTNWGINGALGGDNIAISEAGVYDITLDIAKNELKLGLAKLGTYPGGIGIIGSATPGGWDADTDLIQDADNANLWTAVVTLGEGEFKFRADNDWAVNWGAAEDGQDVTYAGTYNQDGSNLSAVAGTYLVSFNSADFTATLELLEPYESLGLVGDATGSWDVDQDLTQNPANPVLYSGLFTLTDGQVKIRANDGWDVNWGAEQEGTTASNSIIGSLGGQNITVEAGTYYVTFNVKTLEMSLIK